LQLAGCVVRADDGARSGVTCERGKLWEYAPVEQDWIAHTILVERGKNGGTRLSPSGDERVDDMRIDTGLIAKDEYCRIDF
jgi:hypothetical protein